MKICNIDNETSAQLAIDDWRTAPKTLQCKNIRTAIVSLELSQMYYEQKGNEQGVERSGRCIALLQNRLLELGSGE